MKGPGLRIDLDVRRIWRCPRCGKERRAAADVTALDCGCAPDNPRMQLVETQRRVRPEPKPLDLVLEIDLDTPDPDDAGNVTESDDAGNVTESDDAGNVTESIPEETVATQATTDDRSDPSESDSGQRRQRRRRNRNGTPTVESPTTRDAVAPTDGMESESTTAGATREEAAPAEAPDDFGAGLADEPSPAAADETET